MTTGNEYGHHYDGRDETSPTDAQLQAMVDVSNFKLGALPTPNDPRTLRFEDFLLPSALPPAVFSNSTQVNPWGMLANDRYGNCVPAGHAHNDMLQSKLAGTPNRPTDQEVIDWYLQGTNGQDVGYVIGRMLRELRKTRPFEGRTILGFAHVDPRNTMMAKMAISMFGSLYRGILLPNTAKEQTGPGKRWVFVTPVGDGLPSSWGPHMTLDTGYDISNFETVTWGQVQSVAVDFYVKYSMESWVVIPMYPVPGFDHAKFAQALRDIGTNVDVDPVPPLPTPPPTPNPPPTPTPGGPTPPSQDWLPDQQTLNRYVSTVMGPFSRFVTDLNLVTEKGVVWPVHAEGDVRKPGG